MSWMSYLKNFYNNKKKTDPSYKYSSAMKDAAVSYKKDKGKSGPAEGPALAAPKIGKTRKKSRRSTKSRRSGKSRRVKRA